MTKIRKKEVFETTDRKIFDNYNEAEKHQSLIDKVDKVVKLLGGTNNDICPNGCGFSNGEGYYKLDEESVLKSINITKDIKKDLNMSEIGITSRVAYENEYLGKISSIWMCLIEESNGNFIRVGQAYYVQNRDKVGSIIYN